MTFDLHFYLSLVIRRLPIVVAIIFTATTAGILYAVSLPPIFRAEARLLIENAQIPDELAASTVRSTADEILLAIQQRILTRDNLLDLATRYDIFANTPDISPENMLEQIGSRVAIYMPTTQGNTGVVAVSYAASEPELSALVTNDIADQVLQWSIELRTGASGRTLDFFEQEVRRLTDELGQQNAKIIEFEQQNRDALPESLEYRRTRQTSQQERLLQVDRELAALRDRRQRLTELYDRTGRLVMSDDDRTPEEARLEVLRQELASALVVFSPSNPRVRALQTEVAALEEVVKEQLGASGGGKLTAFEVQMLDIDGQITYLAEQKGLVEKELVALDASIEATPSNSIRLFGFESALIQLRQVTKAHFDTAWTFAASLGLLIAVLVVLLAPWIADFYDDQRLKPVLWALALAAAFNGLESNGPVMFRKELQWKQDFLFQVTRKMAAVLIMIPLAFWMRNYWALVWGTVAGRFASLVVSYLITPHRPRFTLAAKADLWNFSKWVFLSNILSFLRLRLPNLMLGKLGGAADAGYFSLARDIARLPTTELSVPIARAAFPGYAKISHNVTRLGAGFLKLLGAVGIFVIPAGLGIAVTADLVVRVFLGDRWLPVAATLSILGAYGAIGGLQANGMAVYLAIGKPRMQFLMQLLFIAVLLPAAYILTIDHGHSGTAAAYVIAGLIVVPVNLANLCHCLGLPLTRFLSPLWRTWAAALTMSLLIVAVRRLLGPADSVLAAATHLGALAALGALTYIATLFALWGLSGCPDTAEKWLIDEAGKRLQRPHASGRVE